VQVEDLVGQSAPATSGAFVESVQSGTGADSAGIQTGDVITSINGTPVTDSKSLRDALGPLHPGTSVNVGWVDSAGKARSASVKLVVGPPL
jgi:serine protease Do